eukprot:TRINITY_DN94045_c0_g1_i1.p1 TRINITY_DN94045_c0_g1~~TRINITY_DN94045_c0_g1_i1.p1  ORF type:complete len:349 (-),score=62.27 TRINITY_DN94045_c0_g1_i1:245-1291(-)
MQPSRATSVTALSSAALLGAAAAWGLARLIERQRSRKETARAQNQSRLSIRSAIVTGADGMPSTPAGKLRKLLAEKKIITMPCCYDALTARIVEASGFELTFMTGFGVSAARGYPDCQLVSYQEMLDTAFSICSSLRNTVCFGDGDTGYGNAINVKRTVRGYAQAGMAGIMIEDQVSPKRCGHTRGKSVVSRAEAMSRVRAACDARDEGLQDIVIMARTDARGVEGLDEAIARCIAFVEAGADITFLEAPLSEAEMVRYCREVPGLKMVNMLPSGKTPMLPHSRLEEIGFCIAAYPLMLLSAGLSAQLEALRRLREGQETDSLQLDFERLKDVVGFNDYYQEEDRYRV